MSADETSSEWDLPERVVHDLLADPRCERVLRRLLAADHPMTVRELAERVASDERAADVETVRGDLYDHYLPRLTAIALVTYDPQHATVRLSDSGRRFIADG